MENLIDYKCFIHSDNVFMRNIFCLRESLIDAIPVPTQDNFITH